LFLTILNISKRRYC